jgi:hypothetical protein
MLLLSLFIESSVRVGRARVEMGEHFRLVFISIHVVFHVDSIGLTSVEVPGEVALSSGDLKSLKFA